VSTAAAAGEAPNAAMRTPSAVPIRDLRLKRFLMT
jgi:hypothetical protein